MSDDNTIRCKVCQGPIDLMPEYEMHDGDIYPEQWEHEAPYPTEYHDAEPDWSHIQVNIIGTPEWIAQRKANQVLRATVTPTCDD